MKIQIKLTSKKEITSSRNPIHTPLNSKISKLSYVSRTPISQQKIIKNEMNS